ncbi:hypothetical protein ACYSNU_18850, partial [Enterococcus sp. LJL120]
QLNELRNKSMASEVLQTISFGKQFSNPLEDSYIRRLEQLLSRPLYINLDGSVTLDEREVGRIIAPTVKVKNEEVETMLNKVYGR